MLPTKGVGQFLNVPLMGEMSPTCLKSCNGALRNTQTLFLWKKFQAVRVVSATKY